MLQNLLDHADKVDATLSDHGILEELADGRSTHFVEENGLTLISVGHRVDIDLP